MESNRLERDLTFARIELNDAQVDELDPEAVAGFAERVMIDTAALWRKGNVRQKRRLQAAVFPEGVIWDGSAIGTAATSPAFSYLQQIAAGGEELVSQEGLEPNPSIQGPPRQGTRRKPLPYRRRRLRRPPRFAPGPPPFSPRDFGRGP